MAVDVGCGTSDKLLKRMVRTIRQERLVARGQHLLVAISGGVDSVVLLSLTAALAPSWHLKVTAVHFNYRLRGSESDGDEEFVSRLCREREIPLIVQRPVLTKRRNVSSLQALARELRYESMAALARELGVDRILTAHTANDQAETVLLWMLRGAGLTGLTGIPFMRDGLIVRPLLGVPRQEILDYAERKGLSYRQDSSNESGRYRRNRIRRDLLPIMREIVPAVVPLLQRQAELLRADESYLEQVVRQLYTSFVSRESAKGQRLSRREFSALPVALQRRLVRMMLRKLDPEERPSGLRLVEAVRRFCLNGKDGTGLSLRRARIKREQEHIWLTGNPTLVSDQAAASHLDGDTVPVPIPATVYWPGTGQEIHVQVMPRRMALSLMRMPGPDRAVFDADRMSEPLVVRGWRAGDRFHPSGMNGKKKKLQDLFTDMKIASRARRRIPLLAAPEGILWVVGCRQDERFRVHERTSRCLVVTVKAGSAREGVR